MNLSDQLDRLKTIYIDTAPKFGPLAKEIVDSFRSGRLSAISSVITLVEVLPKPVESGNDELARRKFSKFLKTGKNIKLMDISAEIAELAGNLRGQYPSL